MHPNAAFRCDGDTHSTDFVEKVGLGMVFFQTPDGPRVAHTPLLATSDHTVQFHLARGNALTRHLPTGDALIVVNGADEYISPRCYSSPDQVPTWNYIAIELQGLVRRLELAELVTFLERITHRHENRIKHGIPWTMDKVPEEKLMKLFKGVVGFEMEIDGYREATKLSQNKDPLERQRLIDGLLGNGNVVMADLMRSQRI